MSDKFTHSIELIEGYTDKEQVQHKKVTFGRRPTTGLLMTLDRDPQAQNPTQYQDLIRRLMITEFGTLKMPIMLPVLAALDTIDRDDLATAADKFLSLSRGDAPGEFLPNNEVRLMFGLTIESTTYDVIKFGNRMTGKDEVEADILGLQGLSREVFRVGKQVSEIRHSESGLSVNGQLSLEQLGALDGEDFNLLRVGAELFRQSFRAKRKAVSE